MRILLIGYYGSKNLGDDLMLNNLLDYLTNVSYVKKVYVIVTENYYRHKDDKILFISKNDKISKFKKIFYLLKSSVVVWGGGTCFYDNDGLYSLYKYWKLSKLLNKRFIFLGIGIGKLSGKFKDLSIKIIKNSHYISTRDEYSFNFVKRYNKNTCLGGDLVFLKYSETNIKLNRKKNNKQLKNISFSGIYMGNKSISFYSEQLKKLINELGVIIHFLPAHEKDIDFHKKLSANLPNKNVRLINNFDIEKYQNVMQYMDFHIGMRLHSIVLADIFSVPNLGIEYANKVRYYLEKSNSLDRLLKLYSPIHPELIKKILYNYNPNIDFMKKEKETSLKCLNKFWRIE